jgi:hypothetical protein
MNSGGWIEQAEIDIAVHCDDDTDKPDSELKKLVEFSHEMGAAFGTDFHIARGMKQLMEAAGFEKVREAEFKLPLGPWSTNPRYREIGKFFERFYKTGLQGWLMHICTTKFGVSRPDTNISATSNFYSGKQRTLTGR